MEELSWSRRPAAPCVGFGRRSKILPSALPLADHDAGRLVVAAAFQLAAGGDVGIVVDVRAPPSPWASAAASRRDAGCRRDCRVLPPPPPAGVGRRFSANCSSVQPPATTIHEPGFCAFAAWRDLLQRLLQAWARRSSSPRCRRSARRGCRGCGRRSVRGSPCGRRDRSISPCRPASFLIAAVVPVRQHPAVCDRKRLANRKVLVDGENLAVEKYACRRFQPKPRLSKGRGQERRDRSSND